MKVYGSFTEISRLQVRELLLAKLWLPLWAKVAALACCAINTATGLLVEPSLWVTALGARIDLLLLELVFAAKTKMHRIARSGTLQIRT